MRPAVRSLVVLLVLLAVFASGVLVGQLRMLRVHDERVRVLRAELQSWKAHVLGMPVDSLMSSD